MHTADKRRHMLQHDWRQLGAQKLLPDHISGSAATFRHAFQTQNTTCNHCEMSGSYPGRSSEPCMVSVWALGSTWAICRNNSRASPGLTMQWCHAAAPPATQQPPQTAARRRACADRHAKGTVMPSSSWTSAPHHQALQVAFFSANWLDDPKHDSFITVLMTMYAGTDCSLLTIMISRLLHYRSEVDLWHHLQGRLTSPSLTRKQFCRSCTGE